jgi:hypothetical protein
MGNGYSLHSVDNGRAEDEDKMRRGYQSIFFFFLFKFLYSMLEKGKGQKVRNRQSTTKTRHALLISHINFFI